jgi:hypothetical protein
VLPDTRIFDPGKMKNTGGKTAGAP